MFSAVIYNKIINRFELKAVILSILIDNVFVIKDEGNNIIFISI